MAKRLDQSFKDMESMFKRNFPQITKGKDRAAVRQIMRDMGYGYGTGLNKEMRKNKGISTFKYGGKVTKINIGTNDYRSGGMVLNSVDNRKSKS